MEAFQTSSDKIKSWLHLNFIYFLILIYFINDDTLNVTKPKIETGPLILYGNQVASKYYSPVVFSLFTETIEVTYLYSFGMR